MTNSFYNSTGEPGTGAFAASAPMRSEFQDIEAGFNKMPQLTAGTAVVVNGAGTALANTVGTLALAGNFRTTGAFAVTLASSAAVTLTLPGVDGALATLAGAETFSNKTFGANNNMGTPTALVGTNITGTAVGLTAGSVTTNANLTGPITSVGNATSIASQTGTGTKFVVDTSPTLVTPTLVTPVLGVATATSINGLTITASTGVLTIANGKTHAVNNSIALSGTDGTTMTFPGTSATVARTDAANTFTGVQTFSTPIAVGSVATMTATVGGGVPTPPNNTTTFLRGDGTFAAPTASGTVTTVSVATANGFAGTVANATTAPAITITTSINSPVLAGNGTAISAATTTGTGSTVVLQGTPTLTTPVLGVATGTSLALGGATIATNALAVTGTTLMSGAVQVNATITTNSNITVTSGGGIIVGGFDANIQTTGAVRATLYYALGTTLAGADASIYRISSGVLGVGTGVASGTGGFQAGATTLSGALTYGGVTLSNAVTGTGNMVLSASPTLSGTVGGALTFSGAHTLSAALTYGGVTLSNSVTGTGAMVLSASPTFTGTVTIGALASATTATTQAAVDNSTKIATTAYADRAGPRAWVSFDSSGIILASYNVTSVVKSSTGVYTITFTTAFTGTTSYGGVATLGSAVSLVATCANTSSSVSVVTTLNTVTQVVQDGAANAAFFGT